MPEIIKCPMCQRQLQIDAGSYGQWFKCPSCGGTFQIAPPPGSPARAAAPAAAPRAPERPAVPPRVWQPPRPETIQVRADAPVREDLDIRNQVRDTPPAPHRGILILALGFIALALYPISPIGWILGGMATGMGGDDLRRMQRGTMDRSGEIMTLIGRACGLLAVILATVAVLWYLWTFFTAAGGG
jgi:hypothetical protein